MTRRYFAPELAAAGGIVQLSDEEAAHASRVMRAQVGDMIELFDGRGHQAAATIQSIDKRKCTVVAQTPLVVDREPKRRAHLGIAFPKPERAKEMIERLTELGIHQVTPIICERTQRPPTDSLLTKLSRVVVESSKQCGRNVLMTIAPATPLNVFLRQTQDLAQTQDAVRWIAHPDGPAGNAIAAALPQDTAVEALVGPEGGFSEDEVQAAVESGYQPIGLGSRILRIETAATVLAALLAE